MTMTTSMPTWIHRDWDVIAPARRRDVITHGLEGEIIVADQSNGLTYHLNPTAFAVLQGCDGRTTTRRIAERLSKDREREVRSLGVGEAEP